MTVAALREVRLYGDLGRRFGRLHRLAVLTPAEAVQALCAVLPGFERAFVGHPGRPPRRYHVFVGRGAQRAAIIHEQASDPVGLTEPIRVVPVIEGAKRGGFFGVLLGVALLIAAPYAAGALWATGASVGMSVGTATYGAAIGKALILGGLIQLVSPQRRDGGRAERPDSLPSYGFDAGPLNTTQQGLPVPLAFGRMVIGSAEISKGLATDDLVPSAPAPAMPPNTLPAYQPADPWADRWGQGGAP